MREDFSFETEDEEPLKVAESKEPTPYAVTCFQGCEGDESRLIYMTYEFYMAQMRSSNNRWVCPRCFCNASWSDENYNEKMEHFREEWEKQYRGVSEAVVEAIEEYDERVREGVEEDSGEE